MLTSNAFLPVHVWAPFFITFFCITFTGVVSLVCSFVRLTLSLIAVISLGFSFSFCWFCFHKFRLNGWETYIWQCYNWVKTITNFTIQVSVDNLILASLILRLRIIESFPVNKYELVPKHGSGQMNIRDYPISQVQINFSSLIDVVNIIIFWKIPSQP